MGDSMMEKKNIPHNLSFRIFPLFDLFFNQRKEIHAL